MDYSRYEVTFLNTQTIHYYKNEKIEEKEQESN
jgi:hypothetical protein